MSRIGKQPVGFPTGVTVSLSGSLIRVEGAKGKLSFTMPPSINATIDQSARSITFKRDGDEAQAKALHGLTRALVRNMVQGVVEGYEKRLDIVGVGYQAKTEGKTLRLQVGFAHPVLKPIPAGLVVETPSAVKVIIKGADRQMVGQFAAEVRKVRPPEPYNGKGIRYDDERVRRKAGKSFVSGGD
jgi:large subunit ribosomal protein L6